MELLDDLLTEPAVYPGHPVTIAYIIFQKYSSLEDAFATGYQFPRALEDNDIPGAGGRVHAALRFLRGYQGGQELKELFALADRIWASERGCFRDHEKGQEQADKIKKWWVGQRKG